MLDDDAFTAHAYVSTVIIALRMEISVPTYISIDYGVLPVEKNALMNVSNAGA